MQTEFNYLNEYTLGAQLGYSLENGSVYLNALADPGDFFQIDLTAGFDVSDDIYVGVNSTYATDNFFGAAGYLQYGVSDDLAVGARLEYFADQGIGVVGEDESIIDLTFSGSYSVGKLKFIPEFRVDLYSTDQTLKQATFNDNGSIDSEAVTGKSLASFVLGAVYEF